MYIYFKCFFLNTTVVGKKHDINITLKRAVIKIVKFNNKTAVL